MAILSPSLAVLRAEIDSRWPTRDRATDGWIGDVRHQARPTSDHNPDLRGIVHAIDVDRDLNLASDPDAMEDVVAELVARKDPRLKYVIYRRRIWSSSWDWAERPYSGSNPHTTHAHISGVYGTERENDRGGWDVSAGTGFQARIDAVPGQRVLARWSVGTDVAYLQEVLGVEADGYFGADTEAAVHRFQRMHELDVDGLVGPATWRVVLAPVPGVVLALGDDHELAAALARYFRRDVAVLGDVADVPDRAPVVAVGGPAVRAVAPDAPVGVAAELEDGTVVALYGRGRAQTALFAVEIFAEGRF